MQDHSPISEPLVSIIIPCYNQARYLRECLDSVRAQTVTQWEAIVVDDCSPDSPDIQQVVRELADPRIRLVRHERNRGLAAARNTGILAAACEIVLCVDADDKLEPTYLEKLLPVLEGDDNVDCVFPDYQLFGRVQRVSRKEVPTVREVVLCHHIPGAGILMRRSLWERVGGFDEADQLRIGGEDWEFVIRAFAAGWSPVRYPEPAYLYRIEENSQTLGGRRLNHLVRRYIYHKHRRLFDESGHKRAFLAGGFYNAASVALDEGRPLPALGLALKAFRYSLSRKGVKVLLRSLRALAQPGRYRRGQE